MGLEIRPAAEDELPDCARLMSESEPWLTLRRGYDHCLAALRDPSREKYVAADRAGLAGLIVVAMTGPFRGYVQTVVVAHDRRGQGVGRALLAFAERRILREVPNVFICVSSFNPRARKLYESLGFSLVGELKDYVVAGHSELLLRKTAGPIDGYRPAAAEAA